MVRHLVGFKTVVVFDETQLVSPPATPEPQKPALLGGNDPAGLGRALEAIITSRSWRGDFDDSISPATGRTDFQSHTVTLRQHLSPAQTAKTLAHEVAHMELHAPDQAGSSLERAVKEVEAESVAWLIDHHWGLDASSYSLPYLAHWSRGDRQVLVDTAHRAVTTARRMIQELDEPVSVARATASPGQWPALTAFPSADQTTQRLARRPTISDSVRPGR